MVKNKNLALELLKFIAVVIVANSHMDSLYGYYSHLATGGAIGDALFFFASGFTLFLGRFGRFDNWYKRRVKRIYPSLIAWAVFLSTTNIRQYTFDQIANGWTGFWFVCCIMIYYVILYFVRRFFESHPFVPFSLTFLTVLICYFLIDRQNLSMYGASYFRWTFYFLFMLGGAYCGNNTIQIRIKQRLNAFIFILSLFLFYGIQYVVATNPVLIDLQILTLLPLAGIVSSVYVFCNSERLQNVMRGKPGVLIRSVSGLCLEAYIVQYVIIDFLSGRIDSLFPLNLIIAFLLILMLAYFIRTFGRIFSQTFAEEDFDWKRIFSLVE